MKPLSVEDGTNEETFPDCKHCGHPGASHDDEWGTCQHLGRTDTLHEVCQCRGYEDPADYEERMDRERQMVYEMNADIDRRMR